MLTAEPKAHGTSWTNATRVESPARARLSVELDVDVCVIGAGLAGLTAAREVARRGWSVVVLEAQSVAWDASGRSAGIVRPGFALGAQALAERVGLDHARHLWALSVSGAEYVRETARDMPGAMLAETGWLSVSTTDRTKSVAAEAALLVGEFATLVEPWPAARVQETLRTSHYFHGLHYPQGFSLHPLNYALGLAAAAETAGARIFEDTPVREIDPAGVRKRIVTAGARVRAAHVVLAGGVHLGALLPRLSSTLVPVFNTAIVTAPLGEALGEAIGYAGAISDGDLAGHHHRVVDGDRLMWSGRGMVWRGRPHRFAGALLREIAQIYPALREAKVGYAWSGAIGETVHGMPQVGEISPGVWLLSGFGNHGINTTAMGGELVARAIVEGDSTWRLFEPFPLVWAGGGMGRAAKQVFAWTSQTQGHVEGALARRREARRLAAEADAAEVKRFSRIAAAAAPPPEPSVMQRVRPSIENIAEPIEPVEETVSVVAQHPEETLPPAEVIQPEPLPPIAVEPSQERVPEPPSIIAEPVPVVPKRKRGPKKKKAAPRRKTLGDFSKQIVEGEPSDASNTGDAGVAPPSPDTPPVNKKV